jgi:hypothetical protein
LQHYLRNDRSIREYFDPFAGKSFPLKAGFRHRVKGLLISGIGLALSEEAHAESHHYLRAEKTGTDSPADQPRRFSGDCGRFCPFASQHFSSGP